MDPGQTKVSVRGRGQETAEVTLERSFQGLIDEWNRPPIQELQDGIYYVNLDKAPWNTIQPELDKLANARGVVFDMRGYPKGNHQIIWNGKNDFGQSVSSGVYFYVLKYLTKED